MGRVKYNFVNLFLQFLILKEEEINGLKTDKVLLVVFLSMLVLRQLLKNSYKMFSENLNKV